MSSVIWSNLFAILQDSESEEEFVPQSLVNNDEGFRLLIRR
jgi:hypothetical protein